MQSAVATLMCQQYEAGNFKLYLFSSICTDFSGYDLICKKSPNLLVDRPQLAGKMFSPTSWQLVAGSCRLSVDEIGWKEENSAAPKYFFVFSLVITAVTCSLHQPDWSGSHLVPGCSGVKL